MEAFFGSPVGIGTVVLLFAALHVTAWIIHMLLLVALLSLVWHLMTGNKPGS